MRDRKKPKTSQLYVRWDITLKGTKKKLNLLYHVYSQYDADAFADHLRELYPSATVEITPI